MSSLAPARSVQLKVSSYVHGRSSSGWSSGLNVLQHCLSYCSIIQAWLYSSWNGIRRYWKFQVCCQCSIRHYLRMRTRTSACCLRTSIIVWNGDPHSNLQRELCRSTGGCDSKQWFRIWNKSDRISRLHQQRLYRHRDTAWPASSESNHFDKVNADYYSQDID